MKRIQLLIVSSIFIASASNAQISKGSVLLGGGISTYKEKSENNNDEGKGTGFSLSPALGFVVDENKVFGVKAGYGRNTVKITPSAYESESNSFNAGIFYRRYLPIVRSFYLFGEAGLAYGKSEYEFTNPGGSTTRYSENISSIGLTLFPGIAYAVSKRFHLEASINNLLNLSYSKNEQETVSTISAPSRNETKRFDLSANVSSSAPLTLGFRIVLGK